MTDFNLTLGYLRDAVLDDLGDVAGLIGGDFIDRAINEGQRRLEPDILLDKTAAVSLVADAATYALPADLVEITRFLPDPTATSQPDFPGYQRHGATIYFHCPLTVAWAGTLLYRAHFPAITDDAPCQLPAGAADALISFGLYKSFRRLASNRAEYRKFATIVGNGTTMADLENTAEAHLQDFADAGNAAAVLPSPATSYGD